VYRCSKALASSFSKPDNEDACHVISDNKILLKIMKRISKTLARMRALKKIFT